MTDFSDFWTRIEGPWLAKHAYYRYSTGCFRISEESISRRLALAQLIAGLGIGVSLLYFVAVPAIEMLAYLAR